MKAEGLDRYAECENHAAGTKSRLSSSADAFVPSADMQRGSPADFTIFPSTGSMLNSSFDNLVGVRVGANEDRATLELMRQYLQDTSLQGVEPRGLLHPSSHSHLSQPPLSHHNFDSTNLIRGASSLRDYPRSPCVASGRFPSPDRNHLPYYHNRPHSDFDLYITPGLSATNLQDGSNFYTSTTRSMMMINEAGNPFPGLLPPQSYVPQIPFGHQVEGRASPPKFDAPPIWQNADYESSRSWRELNVRMGLNASYTTPGPPASHIPVMSTPPGPPLLSDEGDHVGAGRGPGRRTRKRGGRRKSLQPKGGAGTIENVSEALRTKSGSLAVQARIDSFKTDEERQDFLTRTLSSVDIGEAAANQYGNYVIQKCLQYGSDATREKIIKVIESDLIEFCLLVGGCRVVQLILGHGNVEQHRRMYEIIKPQLVLLVCDQNGNHVVQRAISSFSLGMTQELVIDIIPTAEDIRRLSMHQYGCRVIQRVLERAPKFDEVLMERINETIIHNFGEFVNHQYGNYIVQQVLRESGACYVKRIQKMTLANFRDFAEHKYASNALEECVRSPYCGDVLLRCMETLPNDKNELQELLCHEFANYVFQQILNSEHEEAVNEVLRKVEAVDIDYEAFRISETGKKIGALLEDLLVKRRRLK